MNANDIVRESEDMMAMVRASADLDEWCDNMDRAAKSAMRRLTLLHADSPDDPWFIDKSAIIDEVDIKVFIATAFSSVDHLINEATIGYHVTHSNSSRLATLWGVGGNLFNGSGVYPSYAYGSKGIDFKTGVRKYAQHATIAFDELAVMKKHYGETITMLKMQDDDAVIKWARCPIVDGKIMSIWD